MLGVMCLKKIILIAALFVAIIAPTAWYVGSPYLALKELKEAVREGNRDTLADKVDFPAVRESIKSQFKVAMFADLAKEKESNPFSAYGGMLAMTMIEPIVDLVISPDGLRAMIDKGKINTKAEAGIADASEVTWSVTYRGLDKFTAKPETENAKGFELVFKRDGVSWRLIDVVLPDPGLAS